MMDRNTNQERSIMAHTIKDAQVSGMLAAMDSSFSGEIPARFERDTSLRTAWIEAYNSMAAATDQRCYSPDMFEKMAPKPRKKAAKTVVASTTAPQPAPIPRPMAPILEEQYAGHP